MRTLLFLLFSLCVLPFNEASATRLDRLEASVYSSTILKSDVTTFRKLAPLRAQLDPLFPGTPLAENVGKAKDIEIVNFLADEKIILYHFPVPDSEVEQEIQSIQTSNRISRKDLKAALTNQGYRYDDYFELIRNGVSKRNLVDREIRPKVVITDEEAKNQWVHSGGKVQANTPQIYSFELLKIDPSQYKSPLLAKEALTQARKAVLSGEKTLTEASKDILGAPAEGPLEFKSLHESEINPELRNSIRGLKPNAVSPVLGNAKSGFFLVKMTTLSKEADSVFERAKEDVKNQLMTKEFKNQIQLWLSQKRAQAQIHFAQGE